LNSAFANWKHLAALAVAALLGSCAPGGGDIAVNDTRAADTLYRVNDDEIQSLDPHKISTIVDSRVAKDLFEGLTSYGQDGSVVPGLAESWTVSPDGKTWTFRLREGLRFSDGAPITSADVIFSVRRLLAPATASAYSSILYPVQGAEEANKGKAPMDAIAVRAPDARTVVYTLKKPFPAFSELLAHSSQVVVPRHKVEADKDWARADRIVSSGAFRMVRWQLQDHIELAKNPYYHNARKVALAKVRYIPISDDQTAIRKMRAREVDIVGDFPTQRLPLLREQIPDAIRLADWRGTYYFAFNTRKPPFNDIRIRQAMSMAIDRRILTDEVFRIGNKPAYSMVPPGLGGYGTALKPAWADWPMDKRLAQAKRLMAAAGYSPERPLEVELKYNTDEDHKRASLTLMQLWKPLGVRIRLLNSEASVHFAGLKSADFILARSGWIADFNAAENMLFLFECGTGQLNYTGYCNQEYDAAMARAYAEPDPAKRNALFRVAEAMIVRDTPGLFLYFYRTKNLVSPDVQGWIPNYANEHPSKYLTVKRQQRSAP
jgi:oligopeptide transport system substrate-binding protein